MLTRTHLAITIFFVLFLLNSVQSKTLFVIVALIATLIPDIDSGYSKLGSKKTFRPLQWVVKHRGILHSFTFLILITFFFVLFIPLFALPFFLGYGVHLISDSFTVKGIKPFYPSHKVVSGKIRTGRKAETTIFTLFVLADLFMGVWVVSLYI